jgi:predicted PurR-regulated permease PerM
MVLTAALYWLGIDIEDALLWGTLAALLNFVPYVGPLSGVALLAVVGVVAFDSPRACSCRRRCTWRCT